MSFKATITDGLTETLTFHLLKTREAVGIVLLQWKYLDDLRTFLGSSSAGVSGGSRILVLFFLFFGMGGFWLGVAKSCQLL